MIIKLAIYVLRKSKYSVIIGCDLKEQTIKVKNYVLLYDSEGYKTKFIHKNGTTVFYDKEETE